MRTSAILIAIILCLIPLLAANLSLAPESPVQLVAFNEPQTRVIRQGDANFDMCELCVQLMNQSMNTLLQIILQSGVLGSCAALCSYLGSYGQLAVTACNLICDVVGIEAFAKLIKEADLDAVWMCESVRVCPIHDCTADVCAKFVDSNIVPRSGPKGTTFSFDQVFQVLEQTGVGTILFQVAPPAGHILGTEQLVAKGFQPGTYEIRYALQIQDDPAHEVHFPVGLYKTESQICQGLCGSHHTHSRLLASKQGNFTVTGH